jgi:flagellar motor switch protein FliG
MTTARDGLRKAAVLLASLPTEQRAQLLGRLELRQAAAVTAEIDKLREVTGAEQEIVAREFAQANAARHARRQTAGAAPFRFLHDLDSDALLDLIADEHPQTIAMVLSHLPPRQAAAVLAGLTPEGQLSVVCRIATTDEVAPEVVRDVEQGLKRRLSGAIDPPTGNRGVAGVIKMLNVMEPATERRLLGDLAEAAPELVREIRRAMFGDDAAASEEWSMAEAAG